MTGLRKVSTHFICFWEISDKPEQYEAQNIVYISGMIYGHKLKMWLCVWIIAFRAINVVNSGMFDGFDGCKLQFDCYVAEYSSRVLWQRGAVFSRLVFVPLSMRWLHCCGCNVCDSIRGGQTQKNREELGENMDRWLKLNIFVLWFQKYFTQ